MKKKRMAIAGLSMFMLLAAPVVSYAGEWKEDAVGWWYQNDDGSYATDVKTLAYWHYYFDENGYVRSFAPSIKAVNFYDFVDVDAEEAKAEEILIAKAEHAEGTPDYVKTYTYESLEFEGRALTAELKVLSPTEAELTMTYNVLPEFADLCLEIGAPEDNAGQDFILSFRYYTMPGEESFSGQYVDSTRSVNGEALRDDIQAVSITKGENCYIFHLKSNQDVFSSHNLVYGYGSIRLIG